MNQNHIIHNNTYILFFFLLLLNGNLINVFYSLLFEKYNKEIFRKYKWYRYLNRKHADTKLVKEIKKEFGRDVIIFYGDASVGKGCCKKGNISTPNIAIKRLIQNNFKMYNFTILSK